MTRLLGLPQQLSHQLLGGGLFANLGMFDPNGMNGIEACRVISALPHAPPVVLVTLQEVADFHAAALQSGAQELIEKSQFSTAVPALLASLARYNRARQARSGPELIAE